MRNASVYLPHYSVQQSVQVQGTCDSGVRRLALEDYKLTSNTQNRKKIKAQLCKLTLTHLDFTPFK